MSGQVIWEAQAIDQAAGFLRDDPDRVREMLDAVARLANEPRPGGSFPYAVTGPAAAARRPLPGDVRHHCRGEVGLAPLDLSGYCPAAHHSPRGRHDGLAFTILSVCIRVMGSGARRPGGSPSRWSQSRRAWRSA